jgi:hypothetical protein
MTVRPMRPTIAAMNIRIGMRWRTTKPPAGAAQAFAAQHRKAGEEKLDRNENKQPRKSGKRRVFGEVFDA